MSAEYEFEIKPQVLKTKEKFESQANYYLAKLEEFKKLEKTMKQYESNIKAYMVENKLNNYSTEYGCFNITVSKVNCLNRALIEDIKQYYQETKRVTLRKSVAFKEDKPKVAQKHLDELDLII